MSAYLSELIDYLADIPAHLMLPRGIRNPHSYRGDYSELGVEPVDTPMPSAQWYQVFSEALGSTYQGWTSGDYKMSSYSEVYLANEGETGDQLTLAYLKLLVDVAQSTDPAGAPSTEAAAPPEPDPTFAEVQAKVTEGIGTIVTQLVGMVMQAYELGRAQGRKEATQ